MDNKSLTYFPIPLLTQLYYPCYKTLQWALIKSKIKRPIIFVEYTDKIHNIHRDEILINTIEDEFKNIFGNKLDITNLNNISELCENLLIKNNISIDSIEAFEKKYFSNLNNSASFAAKYLINKSKEVY